MEKKISLVFSGMGYILESYSDFLNLQIANRDTQIKDFIKINKDWKKVGTDIRGGINEFKSASKTN